MILRADDVSTMFIQAGAVRNVMHTDQAQAEQALRGVESGGCADELVITGEPGLSPSD